MSNDHSTTPLWSPTEAQVRATQLHAFTQKASEQAGRSFEDYQSLWEWSTQEAPAFWNLLWDEAGVIGDKGERVFADADHLIDTRWFPDAGLNFAENCLAYASQHPDEPACVFWGEDRVRSTLTNRSLLQAVSQCQSALEEAGIKAGDRVAGYLPNSPYALIAMLTTASLGGVWSSASPDFGVEGVVDRFGQIEPKLLFCTDGYYYGGKWLDVRDKTQAALERIESIARVIECPYAATSYTASERSSDETDSTSPWITWAEFLAADAPNQPHYERVAFDHPLYIMFSSGTTGAPKCIMHGVGGSLLQHLKEHRLHADVHPKDRLFYFTTCGWMMWNWLVSGLASGATLVLYDGNPFANDPALLFDLAVQERVTHFGTSAKYIEACGKADLNPNASHDLSALRVVMSTGSPLAPAGFRFVYDRIKPDVVLSSISGGTDILSCFALGNPTLPVYVGQLQCLGLGMAVDVFDDDGHSLRGDKGDLVCTHSFPSMPIGFWGDESGEKYFDAYFARFDNVWCHGDYVEITEQGGMIIYGRSDAVLNPGGVRIGTAEIYRQVETINEVMESVVIGQQWQDDVRVVLFVVLRDELELDEALTQRIKTQIRSKATPRHVPAKIIQVAEIPRTKSGKIVELAVRNVVHGQAVKNLNSLANPEALAYFKNLEQLTT